MRDLGCRVEGFLALGLRVLGFRVEGFTVLGFGVEGFKGLGLRVLGFRVQGGFELPGFGKRKCQGEGSGHPWTMGGATGREGGRSPKP